MVHLRALTHTDPQGMQPATSLSPAQRTRKPYCRKVPDAVWPAFSLYKSGNGTLDWVMLPAAMVSATWMPFSSVADGQGTYTDSNYTKIPSTHQASLSQALVLHTLLHCLHGPFALPRSSSSSKPQDKLRSCTGVHIPSHTYTLPDTLLPSLCPGQLRGCPRHTDTTRPHKRLPWRAPRPLGQRPGLVLLPIPDFAQLPGAPVKLDGTVKTTVNVPAGVSVSDSQPSGGSWHDQPDP